MNWQNCDDLVNGGDTDGFFNNFLLNTKENEILGSLDHVINNVTYHTTLSGAQTDNNTEVIIKPTPYRNTIINSQTIYVRVENKNNTACNDTSKTFNLEVNRITSNYKRNIVTLNQCDTDTDLITDY